MFNVKRIVCVCVCVSKISYFMWERFDVTQTALRREFYNVAAWYSKKNSDKRDQKKVRTSNLDGCVYTLYCTR